MQEIFSRVCLMCRLICTSKGVSSQDKLWNTSFCPPRIFYIYIYIFFSLHCINEFSQLLFIGYCIFWREVLCFIEVSFCFALCYTSPSCHSKRQVRHRVMERREIFSNLSQNVNCHVPHVKYWMVNTSCVWLIHTVNATYAKTTRKEHALDKQKRMITYS